MGENDLKLVLIDKVMMCFTIVFLFILVFLLVQSTRKPNDTQLVMGGTLNKQAVEEEEKQLISKSEDVETYFRPSNLPVLNNRRIDLDAADTGSEQQKKTPGIKLPKELTAAPEETIVNYFSVLRDAANPEEGKDAGCGTIGESRTPYPVAYQFLSSAYQKELPYKKYLDSFENILHTSLIKYREVPTADNSKDALRYFVELETIGGSKGRGANFTYYYGFVDLIKENDQYKISNLDFTAEDYLCAPFHGWSYDAETSVAIRYGDWCKLIKQQYPAVQEGYVKNVYFSGTDGRDYRIEFVQLTNDTDVEIAEYRSNAKGDWERIILKPKECLEKNKNKQ